ncbi:gliding motility-associated ABC transporter substrate-binding protein GldG [Mucilaginibacter paludis]|uniref:Gliding-associated putative ABC transporter substrate-binding component GldG n=1 Tax=Mucilaginibacter paludis DSM 18603 TaxID=714943 RepID=H1Y4C5_9SPHI|nr:gliding motility-associated ABC transporter substrate-binding protein GldG [Mucilaginibacter paludis]EHQ25759.1 gliding-associated putative ABC transporter substrate-binding component GldG [Mucilaginibacter paludis DSM 18603]
MVGGNRKKDLTQAALFAVAVLVIGFLSARVFTRFDFTKEKRYTLTSISRNLMDSLAKPVKITVYLQGTEMPAGFKRLQGATRDMLTDLQAYSRRTLQFEFVAPLEGMNQQEQAQAIQNLQAKGIEPTNLSVKNDNGLTQKIIFPSALVSSGDKQIPVKLLQTRMGLSYDEQLNNSIQNLEYVFASAIKKVVADGKPEIGFTEGHHELTDLQLNDAMKSLSDGFEVGRVNLKTIPLANLQKIKLLIIAKPDRPFTEDEKFKVDQYLMHGGRVLWSIDQVSAELDSLRGHGSEQLAFAKQLNLDDQLFRYGIRINYDLIMDMNCAQIPVNTGNVAGQGQLQMVPWLFYPIFVPVSKHPLVKNLDGIRSEFASTIDTLAVKGTRKTILLTTSPFNRKLSAPHLLSLQMLEEVPDPKTFQSPVKTVGVLLEGTFISDFRNRPVPDSIHEKVDVLQQSKPTKMIVLSDGDIFKNQVAGDGSPFQLGFDRYTQQSYGNKNLLLNIADYMTDDSGLIGLRTKEVQLRLLDRPRIRSEKLNWQLINNVLPVAMVLIFAIFQHYIRRRKYAR